MLKMAVNIMAQRFPKFCTGGIEIISAAKLGENQYVVVPGLCITHITDNG